MPPRPTLPLRAATSSGASSARARRLALLTIVVLVVARSAVFLFYEQAFFDSDQAIVGLMAKHLAEGRAFPLFYYGQIYMLVVDAWVAAPIFALIGPTVFALHLALVLLNVLVAILLFVCLVRAAGLGPWQAAAALAFFAWAPPLTTASLVEAGANIVPFVSVLLLWMLRRRALWFGLVLGIGVLNREFTIYAVPALLAIELWERGWRDPQRRRFWMVAFVATMATWQSVQALKPFSDMMGPGTRGALVRGSAGSQIGNIADRVSIEPAEIPARTRAMVAGHLPTLFGAARMTDSIANQGRDWLFWPCAAGLIWIGGRAAWLARGRADLDRLRFPSYLVLTGGLAAAAYIATRPADGVVFRYILLTLLIPIGAVAGYLVLEPRRRLRLAVLALVGVWAASSGVDHLAQVRRYWGGREPNETRDLADALVARHIDIARADYWLAYKVAFLTGERVKLASTDVVRIEEYQRLAAAAGPALVRIEAQPCAGGEQVSLWYLCPGP